MLVFSKGPFKEWVEEGIPPKEARHWLAAGIAPIDAVDWINEGFRPGEAKAWERSGCFCPIIASALKDRGHRARRMAQHKELLNQASMGNVSLEAVFNAVDSAHNL